MRTAASQPHRLSQDRTIKIAYLAGTLSALGLVCLIIALAGYQVGYRTLWQGLRMVAKPSEQVLVLPKSLLKELVDIRAVVDNAGNPTEQLSHYTMLVDRDPRLGWALIPNARVSLYMLKANNPMNFDPPVVALSADAKISPELKAYLDQQTRLRYSYSVGSDGFRTTLPKVDAEDRILMVGDSVLFGEGVNDDATMASQLQARVGTLIRVINAGVGGYSGEQALEMAKRESESHRHRALVYVACQNDFMNQAGVSYLSQAERILKMFASLRQQFSGKIVVILQPYMEYVLDDVLQKGDWYREMVNETDRLREGLPSIARELGLEYVDGTQIFQEYMIQSGSVFSRFALFVDDAHLSPLGNRLASERIDAALQKIGAYDEWRKTNASELRHQRGG